MKLRRSTGLIAALVGTVLVVTGCSGAASQAPPEGTDHLKIGISTEVVTWQPLNSASVTDTFVTEQPFPALFTLDAENQVHPHLAKSWELSEDGGTIRLKLNSDFGWSDGEPITAEDVQFTFERIASDKLLAGSAVNISNYAKSEIVSDSEIDIVLKKPSYDWALNLARGAKVLPKHVYEDVPDLSQFNISEHPDKWVSGGAYTFSKMVPGQRYEMVPNTHYPKRAAGNEKIKLVEFLIYSDMNTLQLALRNGDIDIIAPSIPAASVSTLASDQNLTIVETAKGLNNTKLIFNVGRDTPLRDQTVRQAISGVIDVEKPLKIVFQGHAVPAIGPLLPVDYDPFQPDIEPYSYTPQEAKSLLAKAGYNKISLNLGYDSGVANFVKYAEIIRDALTKIGIDVKMVGAERSVTLANAKDNQFDLYISKLNQPYTPATNLNNAYHPGNPRGFQYHYFGEEPKLAAAIESALFALTEEEYVAAVQSATEYIHEKAYSHTLYTESIFVAYNSSRFDGVSATGTETQSAIASHALAQITPR